MDNNTKRLVTTPIFYPNANLHIGHTYTLILSDILKRLLNIIDNNNTYLLTGLDEHGNKVFNAAKANNMEIMNWLNIQFKNLMNLCELLHIDVDIQSRTTNTIHINKVQEIWTILYTKGLIYQGVYSGYYSEKDETYFAIDELVAKDDKYYTQDGALVYYLEENCWYLKINKDEMKEIIRNLNITPNNKSNELLSMLNDDNFGDLCISRKSGWGIAVPNSNEIIYVWLDALVNYITQYDQINNQNVGNNMIHVMGKDIFKFHGLYWTYILKHLGYKMPQLLVHNWFILNNQKMSKSLNNIENPLPLIEKYGYHAVRFYFVYIDLISSDQNFQESDIMSKFNTFIVDKYANLIYRTWSILDKHGYTANIVEIDNILFIDIDIAIKNLNIKEAIHKLFAICAELNGAFERQKAWLKENIEHAVFIAGQLIKIMKYFDCILGDNKSHTIKFHEKPKHVYDRIEI